ncbi:hypothetical protein CYLTODRAFT_49303 [Cylindrobasidium torrendii FP15055 ss-10]|uniref:DUF6534 domain-containing protein n=1 Tax=Cylindrobasidium torrendii FP15055 ss-10 TaxID=1314674 RepID=A0A0D7B8S3_9AGAR|nr:hypothetical protein CYLTODRAFT_49303 [Cylindrobasidium torrendii FP15055 ss-10]
MGAKRFSDKSALLGRHTPNHCFPSLSVCALRNFKAMGAYDSTLGAYLVGVIMAAILLGVACAQATTYFIVYRKDPLWIKATVVFSLITIWGHQISVTDKMYVNTVTYYPDPSILSDIGWGLIAQTWFHAFTAICVQSFYVYRIYILLKNSWYLPAALFSLSVVQFALSAVYAAKCGSIPTEDIPTLSDLVTGVNSIGAGIDIIIAATMIWILLKHRTGFKNTNSVITRLVVYCINSGLLTSICALGTLIALRVAPKTYIAYPFYFCIGRMYVISLLGSLNMRKGIRMESTDGESERPWESYDVGRCAESITVNKPDVHIRGKSPSASVMVSVEQHTEIATDDGIPTKHMKPYGDLKSYQINGAV